MGFGKKTFMSEWVHPEVYPVIACIGGGMAFAAWFGLRTLRNHNDIVINKHKPVQFAESDSPKMYNRTKALHVKQNGLMKL